MANTVVIARAHKIAWELEEDGYSPTDGSMILSMALGIFMEGQVGSHRNLLPIAEAMLKIAQITFDAMREARPEKR